ncbi:outer membrane beta-barrel family protein [Dyadobacter sp. CY356]|uniref:outer membrane beta-barrel family protein n=1 Tax=Dyadobacter sp. CY356 TaxID=2906442 RepID=UPI001F39BBDC|nr:outer membrane beta-barrel family protein [Dyadobacter sp. CY356]MCF0056234.1 TonB-dependent receptor [Dyadobacter sp. CY356]
MKIKNLLQKLLLFALGMYCICTNNFAQTSAKTYRISGFVSDSIAQKKLDYITVNLLSEKGIPVKADYTKSDGSFSFPALQPLKYSIVLVGVGYKNKTVLVDLTDSTKQQSDLGILLLTPQTVGLKEVTITSTKQIVKQEVDRISYDLQADPESKVFSVLDMMRKVPLLSLDADNNILMKGNSDFKILINGKPSSMVERNYKEILRTMPASSIERIEVITTPPAKYDAEGLAGIINIITNKKLDNGYNGTVNVSERFPNGGPGVGGSFSAKIGKMGMSALGGASIFKSPQIINSTSRNTFGIENTMLLQNGTAESKSKSAYLGYEISYEIDSLNLLSGQFNLNGSNSNGENRQVSLLSTPESVLQKYSLANNTGTKGSGIDAAVNYQRGFRADKNRLLTLSYRYFAYTNNQKSNIAITDRLDYDQPDYKQVNDQQFSEQTFQADYIHPYKKLNIEAGLKAILRNNQSDFQNLFENNETGSYEVQPDLSNKFRYDQNVYGAYNTYQYSINKWSFKVGARVEQTLINANFISSESNLSTHYFNVIPSISISKKLVGTTAINLGYTQRIQRPGIYQLNPFIDKSNPNFEKTGNPNLKPALVNDFQIGYNWSKKMSVNFGLGYTFFKNLIFPVAVYDSSTNITRTSYGNTGQAKLPQGNLNLNIPITKKWNFSLNTRVAYGMVRGVVNGNLLKNEGLMYNFSASSGYRFEKSWRVNANLNANGKGVNLQGSTNSFVSTSFSVNKDLYQDKLSFSASVSNPYKKYRRNINNSFGPDFSQSSIRRDYFRTFNFSVNYKFGRLKDAIRKNKRGIRNDDVQNGS